MEREREEGKTTKTRRHECPRRERRKDKRVRRGWRERKRGKDSCYWWLLSGQHASSVTLTTRPGQIVRFCERREISRRFFRPPWTRAIALVEKRTCRTAASDRRSFYVGEELERFFGGEWSITQCRSLRDRRSKLRKKELTRTFIRRRSIQPILFSVWIKSILCQIRNFLKEHLVSKIIKYNRS